MPRGRGKTVGKYFLWPDYNNLLGVKLCIIFNWHYCQPIPFKSIYDLEQVFCAHFFVFMWLYNCVSLQWGCTWVRKPPTGLWWGLQNTMGSFPLKVDFHFKCLFRKTSPSLHCPLHLIHLRVALSPREPHVPTKTFTSLMILVVCICSQHWGFKGSERVQCQMGCNYTLLCGSLQMDRAVALILLHFVW